MTAGPVLADLIDVREARPDDMAFVKGAWGSSYLETLRKVLYTQVEREVSRCRVLVAFDKRDEDLLCGFAAADGSELLYAYVKQPVRRQGIARRLLRDFELKSYSYGTEHGRARLKLDEQGLTYQPPRIVL